MGEDRVAFAEKNGDVLSSRQRHSSVISSCSEDAETESTSTGYPPTPDEEREEELEYGPGIVNKLKTRFLSITLKQNRGMRRSCSMENLLDQDRPSRSSMFLQDRLTTNGQDAEEHKNQIWGNLKRAKSMDTLLMDLQSEPPPTINQPEMNGHTEKKPKIVRRRDGGLLRSIPIISDEELPKPDTVKTYKRMFEPAESRRGSYSRRPPVLRASAKSGTLAVSKSNGVSSSAKVNGTVLKSKLCAKQSPPIKAQPEPESMSNGTGSISSPQINGEDSKPLCNGNYVKAIPIKITDNSLCNGKIEKTVEKKMNILNHNMNKKDIHLQNGAFCNGSFSHKDMAKIETIEEYIKPDVKKLVNQTNKIVNGSESPVTNIVNGIKTKPKVPPNRPAFIKNVRAGSKASELNGIDKKSNLIQKQKPNSSVASKKTPGIAKQENNHKNEESMRSELRLNSDVKTVQQETKTIDESQTVEENDRKSVENIPTETEKVAPLDDADSASKNEPEKEIHSQMNGGISKAPSLDIENSPKSTATDLKLEPKTVKKQQQSSEPITTSMVFDFRGKDVVPHVAVLPVPFGCKALHPKKRPLLIDGKEVPNGKGVASDDEDEYHMDYSVPLPSGVTFEGENVKIGKGSILSTRNKDLKIKFDDSADENTFVYPSETSLLEDGEQQSLSPSPPPSSPEVHPPSPSRLKTNPAMGSSGAGGLSTYTPSVLRTVDNFEPGMFRPLPPTPPPPGKEDTTVQSGEEENTELTHEEEEMLKPADPGIISSWSLSAGTSDLLF